MAAAHPALKAITDTCVRDLLIHLHGEASRQNVGLAARFATQIPRLLRGRPLPWARLEPKLSEMYLALDPANGVFCYLLARAMQARRIVEFGTSFGVSTIYLALAVRDNGGGIVIGTEMLPEKVARARTNLRDAGLDAFVDIREGDALETLRNIDGPVDFLLNDGFPRFTLPVLKLLAPHMRAGAAVLCGNAAAFPADHADYLAWVRDPENGFQSMKLAMKLAGEFSIKAV